MASKSLPTSRTTFTAIPLDVLTHIAFDTVYRSSHAPTLRDLNTVHSLVLTSRIINRKLSLRRNPHLYANIIRLMCDIHPVQRRLGSRAVTASALASELPRRLTMLKRIRRRLSDVDHDDGVRLTDSADLAKLFMMMTEDDGKNRRQIEDILGPSGLADLCFVLLSRHSLSPELNVSMPDLAFVVALMWLNSEDSIIHEDSEKRAAILDYLQPLVLGNVVDGSTAEFEYFGLSCALELPAVTPFARLCTIERYNHARRMLNPPSSGTCIRPPWKWSVRFDDEYARYFKIYPLPSLCGRPFSLPTHNTTGRLFENIWAGGWCIPCPISTTEILMVFRPIKCQLREYVCTQAGFSVSWAAPSQSDEDDLARAWFAQDVVFEETMSSLRIYDPTTALWVSYEPKSELIDPSTVLDTILIGEASAAPHLESVLTVFQQTEPVHGAEFGAYTFYGRVRQSDGRIALVRHPSDPGMDDLGVWVFHGQVFGGFDLVGEWMNTSTAKNTPAGHGWFCLAKDATDYVVEQ